MRQDAVEFLEALLKIPSLSGEEDLLANFLIQRMDDLGFQTHQDQVGNVIGAVGSPHPDRTLVLLGHMDTVAGVVPVRQEKNQLYGRGAVDAKGPLAAFVYAAAQVKDKLRNDQVIVIGAVDEEANSIGARHIAETMDAPDGVIIGEPSGWEGITLGYKGTLRVNYELTKPAGHSAGKEPSPAEEGIAFWNRFVEFAAEFNGDRQPPRFDTLDPALLSITTHGDGLEDKVTLKISLRIPLGVDGETLQDTIVDWSDQSEMTFPFDEPAFRADKNSPVVRALLRAIRQAEGRPRFKLKTGTSDMNIIGPAWDCPIAAYGPGDARLDHTPDEHMDLDEFQRGISVLAKALLLW